MPRKMGYPRNEQSRRDNILQLDIIPGTPRNHLSRNDTLASDPHQANVNPTIALTGTGITDGLLEAQVVTGSETIIITITNGQWSPDLGSDNSITTDFLAAITGDDAGSNGFDAEVALVHGNLVRTSSTVLTLTLPATAGYAIAADETVTIAPPANSVLKGNLPSTATFDISIVTVALSGTMVAGGVTEAQMVTGGETLIVTLTGGTWHADLGSDNATTTAFLAAITGDDDYATIAALTDFEDVARTSATIATITYPAGTGYSIAADEDVTVTIDSSTTGEGVSPATPAAVTITEGA